LEPAVVSEGNAVLRFIEYVSLATN
jgi:hypothetical protein